jgi:DNA-directed RNA polymerase specialized sigma24 family protein
MTTTALPFDVPAGASLPETFLRGLVRVALAWLAQTHPRLYPSTGVEAWVQRAAEILAANVASGRFQVARQYQPADLGGDASLLSYAGQILVELLGESERVEALCRGDTVAWQPVIDRQERLAYHWLGPYQREEWAAWEAREAAAHTCADLWAWLQTHSYPFDVPFDRWSATALNRRLCGGARQRARDERIFDRSLDEPVWNDDTATTFGEQLADTSLDEWLTQATNREALMQAIGLLDSRLALVVRLWYFEQWPANEIAVHIATSIGNVYLLRFRAIEKLRQIAARHERLGLADTLSLLEGEARRSRPAPDLAAKLEEGGT